LKRAAWRRRLKALASRNRPSRVLLPTSNFPQGVRLLDRGPRGLAPTPYGRALIRRGIAIFDELKQGMQDIELLAELCSLPPVGRRLPLPELRRRLAALRSRLVRHCGPRAHSYEQSRCRVGLGRSRGPDPLLNTVGDRRYADQGEPIDCERRMRRNKKRTTLCGARGFHPVLWRADAIPGGMVQPRNTRF
jgi:hypothetical protein